MQLARRLFVTGSLAMSAALALGMGPGVAQDPKPTVTVYKSPS
jgi:hypothetical protein